MPAPLFKRYDHVLVDLDGCVWIGDEVLDGAAEAVGTLRAAGKRIAFLTNDPRHDGETLVRKLWGLGLQASLDEVVTVGGAIQHVLADSPWRTAEVIGAPAIHRHVTDAGLRIVNGSQVPPPDVVVVAAHERFDYDELRSAMRAVLGGAAILGASREATFPMPDGPWPATGPLLAAVEAATGAVATTVGKPEQQLFDTALDRLGPGRALVIGDSLDADLAGAHAAGLDAAIVLTGVTTAAAARAAVNPAPIAVAASLAALVRG